MFLLLFPVPNVVVRIYILPPTTGLEGSRKNTKKITPNAPRSTILRQNYGKYLKIPPRTCHDVDERASHPQPQLSVHPRGASYAAENCNHSSL